jgi:hypothetical protein
VLLPYTLYERKATELKALSTLQMFKVMNPELYFARTDELDGKLTFTQKWYCSHESTQTGADHSTLTILHPPLHLFIYRSICAAGVLMVSW